MGQRSRKRGRREKRAVAPEAAASPSDAQTAARSSRSEARNAAARAALQPLGPRERPWVVTLSAILALLVGGYNLISFLLGTKLALDGRKPGLAGVIPFAAVMFACAVGMWRMRYWAVLGFQVLLAILLLFSALLLIKVSNFAGLAICLAALSVGGLLFYKLVKVLGRMQLPARERR